MTGPDENVKYVLDAAAATSAVATLLGWLPPIAAALTIIWTIIRIYETDTVQRMLGRRK